MTDEHSKLETLDARLARLETAVNEIRQLVGPFGVSFPNGRILVQTIYGIKYFIDAHDEIMTPQLVVYRQWEDELSAFILNSVTGNTCFLDVGANFGYFTCLAAAKIGRAGTGLVIAVEPNPRMFELLTLNIGINWSMAAVEPHSCAASSDDASVDLLIPRSGPANASMLGSAGTAASNAGPIVHVRGRTVDSIVAGRPVHLMKIDVEGHEIRVLEGAAATLAANHDIRIVMEWSLSQMRDAGIDPDDVVNLVESLGFGVYRLPATINVSEQVLSGLRLARSELLETAYANIYLSR